jgi:hypothetical protein
MAAVGGGEIAGINIPRKRSYEGAEVNSLGGCRQVTAEEDRMHDLPNQTAQCGVPNEPRQWIIATAALCLLFAAYLVSKQEFRGTGTSDFSLQHTENVPDETGLPREAYTHPRVSAVITDYFDTSLAELHLARPGSGYTQLEDYDSDWWVLENGTTVDIAPCLASMACGLYDTGRTAMRNFNKSR